VRVQRFVCLLLASVVYGQAAPVVPPQNENRDPAATAKAAEVSVGPDDAIITVNDFCPHGPRPDGSCKTIITRAQFEKLTEALQPGMTLPMRLKVANAYAEMMRMADIAEKRGLDKTPAFAEEMRYARMQLLSQDLTRILQEEANSITDAEVEDYYKKNESSFEEATVARIFIPHTKQLARSGEKHETSSADASVVTPAADQKMPVAHQDEPERQADEAAMAKIAADLRARAANGEDPDRLQTEAYAAAGVPGITANTRTEKVRRNTLPPQHESVLDLKPGEVSQVFSDPGGAHFIYKMISKHVLTLQEAEPEIRSQISTEHFRDSMKPFQGNAAFSDAYFNPPGTSATPPHRNPKDKDRRKPSQAERRQDQN
jgi:hypothetical protein